MTSSAPAPHDRRPIVVVGGGFGGAWTARLLGRAGVTLVAPENFLLFTPLLPEAASGSLELRHAVVPLRQMCPEAELLLGRAVGLDTEARTVTVGHDAGGQTDVAYEHLVLAAGAVPRSFPIPGLVEHAVGVKTVEDALYLRNHVLRELEAAERADGDERARRLTFVFVGAGYAGVEALAELHDLAQDALRHYPRLRGVPQRWVLADTAPRILPEIPDRLANYAARHLAQVGIDVRPRTSVERVEDGRVDMTDGTTLLGRHARLDRRREPRPGARRVRAPARRARSRARRRDAPRRGP